MIAVLCLLAVPLLAPLVDVAVRLAARAVAGVLQLLWLAGWVGRW